MQIARGVVLALTISAVVAAISCGGSSGRAPTDGSSDQVADGLQFPDALDIAVAGCGSYDAASATCSGAPPLTLSFAPVGSPALDHFLWSFGDGSPSAADRAPSHTYAVPGTYVVTLVGGGPSVGTISSRHAITVTVTRLPVGQSCDVDAQCAQGLRCRCAAGSSGDCPSAFARGICTASCNDGLCGDDEPAATCAALPFSTTPDAGASSSSYQSCLAACATDSDCGAGLICLDLPLGGPAGAPTGWTRGCLPAGALAPLGGACRDPDGTPMDAACATGLCADLGARGLCSSRCGSDQPCPAGALCSRLPDGRSLCLPVCGAGHASCDRDPLLACSSLVPPVDAGVTDAGATDAGAGDGAVSSPATPPVTDAGAAASVCGPKACSSDDDCAPAGRCAGGQCASSRG